MQRAPAAHWKWTQQNLEWLGWSWECWCSSRHGNVDELVSIAAWFAMWFAYLWFGVMPTRIYPFALKKKIGWMVKIKQWTLDLKWFDKMSDCVVFKRNVLKYFRTTREIGSIVYTMSTIPLSCLYFCSEPIERSWRYDVPSLLNVLMHVSSSYVHSPNLPAYSSAAQEFCNDKIVSFNL